MISYKYTVVLVLAFSPKHTFKKSVSTIKFEKYFLTDIFSKCICCSNIKESYNSEVWMKEEMVLLRAFQRFLMEFGSRNYTVYTTCSIPSFTSQSCTVSNSLRRHSSITVKRFTPIEEMLSVMFRSKISSRYHHAVIRLYINTWLSSPKEKLSYSGRSRRSKVVVPMSFLQYVLLAHLFIFKISANLMFTAGHILRYLWNANYTWCKMVHLWENYLGFIHIKGI